MPVLFIFYWKLGTCKNWQFRIYGKKVNIHRMNPFRHNYIILTFTFLFSVTTSYGQVGRCDTVYSNPETPPHYDQDTKGLFDYFTKALVPTISDCIKRDTGIIASLYIILTIDNNGKIIDATFPRQNLTSTCKADLKKKLLTMSGWKAGQANGQPVCSNFIWPIGCLKWEWQDAQYWFFIFKIRCL